MISDFKVAAIKDLRTGINQSGVRAYNERLILTLLQRDGPTPGIDLARRTGLSSQTVSVILRKLEGDGLLVRGEPVKGKVGKPSVPFDIAPDGMLAMGLKIGRRSADLLVLSSHGEVVHQLRETYAYPVPDQVFRFLGEGAADLIGRMPAALAARICGIGVAAPFELWNWRDLVGAPTGAFEEWRGVDFNATVAELTNLPVLVINDATAACRAEHMFGEGKSFRDYAYFYLAAFIGGGVVMNNSVYEGGQSNAGAFGSLPVLDKEGQRRQLIDVASIHNLETRIREDGGDPRMLWAVPQDWTEAEPLVGPWIDTTAREIARATLSVCSVIDFEAILIDGALPRDVLRRLVSAMRRYLDHGDTRGLVTPAVTEGVMGGNARAIGAAAGPIIAQYLLDAGSAGYEKP